MTGAQPRSPERPLPSDPARRHYGLVAVTAAIVLVADQLVKWWAVDELSRRSVHLAGPVTLALTHNRGGAFSLGGAFVPFLAVAAVVVVLVMVARGEVARRPVLAVALGMVLGGAFANLGDRLFRSPGLLRGAVVDYVDLGWWPVFNLADVAITCGCAMVLLAGRRASEETR